MTTNTSSQEFFEQMYQRSPDPWDFSSSPYEGQRYDAIVAALGDRRYTRGFEPGCSIGILTFRLASLCGEIIAMDLSPTAVKEARERCKGLANVHLECGILPQSMPAGNFDLIVFSEIGYYFDDAELSGIGQMLVSRLCKSGVFLVAHWLGHSCDHRLHGDRVHEILGSLAEITHQHSENHGKFRLDRWVRA